MVNQLQDHGFSAAGTIEGIFSEGLEEGLGEGVSGYDKKASGVERGSSGFETIQEGSNTGVADVISDN